jgi:putative peptidoglycan lipid II flippase
MAFFKSMATVSGLTLVSRVLGYVRDALIAATFGKTGISDAFFLAFQLPNTFRRLVGEGALSSAFVPMFTKMRDQEGKESAVAFASDVITILTAFLIGLVIIFELGMPVFMGVFAGGFKSTPDKFQLAVNFAYITFPYVLFVSLVAIFSGILNALNRFFTATAAPIILNIFMILALVFTGDHPLAAGYGLTWAVLLAGAAQLLWVIWAVQRTHMRLKIVRPKITPAVKTLLMRMGPGILGAGVYQINMLVSSAIASSMPMAVSYLNYAERITQFPLSIIGAAMGVVLLPLLSRLIAKEDTEQALYTQNRAIQFALLLTLPAATAFVMIALPIVKLLYQYGQFTADMAVDVAWVLGILATGLPAYVMVKILSSNFFARGDTKTPVTAGMIAIGANIVLNLILFQFFGYFGIAASNALSSWLNVILLTLWLRRDGMLQLDRRVRQTVPRLLICCAMMAFGLHTAVTLLLPDMDASVWVKFISVLMLIAGGFVIYVFAVWLTRALSYAEWKESVQRLNKNTQPTDL